MTTWKSPSFTAPGSIRASAELTHWLEAARIIRERHQLPDLPLGMAPSGSDVVIAGKRFFYKLTAPQFTEELTTERNFLTHVEGRLPVATPKVVAFGDLDGWPYVVTTRVMGTPLALVFPALSLEEKKSIAAELGALVAALHRLPLPDDGASWAPFLANCIETAPTRHTKPSVPEALSSSIRSFLLGVERPGSPVSAARSDEANGSQMVLLHTEILDEHIFASMEGDRWKLSAMLDFADGRVGQREYEFPAIAEFIFRGEPGLFPVFLASYGWESSDIDAYAERFLAWGLIHRFGSVERMLRVVGSPAPSSLKELAHRLYR